MFVVYLSDYKFFELAILFLFCGFFFFGFCFDSQFMLRDYVLSWTGLFSSFNSFKDGIVEECCTLKIILINPVTITWFVVWIIILWSFIRMMDMTFLFDVNLLTFSYQKCAFRFNLITNITACFYALTKFSKTLKTTLEHLVEKNSKITWHSSHRKRSKRSLNLF